MKPGLYIVCLLLPLFLVAQKKSVKDEYKMIPPLSDTAGIDGLNAKSQEFTIQGVKDSAEYYAMAAYRASKEIHYARGLAVSLLRKAGIAEHFYNNFVEEKKLAEESLDGLLQSGDKADLPVAYGLLSFSNFVTGDYDKALVLAEKAYGLYNTNRDELGKWDALTTLAAIQIKKGEFDKGFDANKEALTIATKLQDQALIKACMIQLGDLCMAIEDYPLALHYFRAVFETLTKADLLVQSSGEFDVWSKMEFAEIYSHLNMFDSALYRYNLFDTLNAPEKDLRIFLVSKGEYFMLTHEYKKALPSLLRGLFIHQKLNDDNEIMRSLLDIASTYHELQDGKKALLYGRQGLSMALQTDNRQFIRDGYKVLSSVYGSKGQKDSAYSYYRFYIKAKESLAEDQTKGKFAAYQYEQQIGMLNNESLINRQKLRMREQQLKNETRRRNVLIAFAFAILAASILLLSNTSLKRRNEKLKNEAMTRELQHKTTEMEMQALRAQMNPHFIFNCLNSINRFILKNESQTASDYLTRFSRLIRLVLNNSKRTWISLEEETEMLRLYLDMEKLRFKDAFNYMLCTDENIDPSGLFIPPLLLQPFVENAIWHGLMHKKENGLVSIYFKVEGDILHCAIVDNGVGRSFAAMSGSKSSQTHKSMGIRITRDRLALINGDIEDDKIVSFNIEDLFDNRAQAAGTKVSLSIKFQQNMETETESFAPLN